MKEAKYNKGKMLVTDRAILKNVTILATKEQSGRN